MKRLVLLFFLSLAVLSACTPTQQVSNAEPVHVTPFSPDLTYMGRTEALPDSSAMQLYWSGTSIKLNFEGSSVSAKLKNSYRNDYYNVIVDGGQPFVLEIDTLAKSYVLVDSLPQGVHSVELYRRTEWSFGTTSFYGFELPPNSKVLPADAPKKKTIEFYGNSITAGYGVNDYGGKDRWDSLYTNNYDTYASLTARHFDAEMSCIAKSGIGITVSWFDLIMPEMYNRTNPNDSLSTWDFSQKQFDVVVVNLFQNDSWIVLKTTEEIYKHRFSEQAPTEDFIIKSYTEFISSLRSKYPNAKIICMLGSMDATKEGSPWPTYIQKSVDSLNDANMYTLFIPFKDTYGHPNVAEQKAMADTLIQFIQAKVGW